MIASPLPPADEMLRASRARDASYDGVFFLAVRTTGVFCRPTCGARPPRPENVRFFASARDALAAGYRPCKRCRPLAPRGGAPPWLAPLLAEVERAPGRRWTDAELAADGLDPGSVRRWFRREHGMTFHAYARSRRLGLALSDLARGGALAGAGEGAGFASDSGFREAFARLFGASPGAARGARVVRVARLLTPLGPMLAGASEEGLCLFEFADRRMLEAQVRVLRRRTGCLFALGTSDLVRELERQLAEYFEGARRAFDLPLVIAGTPFQERVWRELARIPYGQTRSYEELARTVGSPGGQRAVGRANGDNRLAILLPCHRVVRADGALSGYGGGLWRKRALLDHERGARVLAAPE